MYIHMYVHIILHGNPPIYPCGSRFLVVAEFGSWCLVMTLVSCDVATRRREPNPNRYEPFVNIYANPFNSVATLLTTQCYACPVIMHIEHYLPSGKLPKII